jgi:hypothetical protein
MTDCHAISDASKGAITAVLATKIRRNPDDHGGDVRTHLFQTINHRRRSLSRFLKMFNYVH